MTTTNAKYLGLVAALAVAIIAPFLLTSDYDREILVLICIFAIAGLSLDIIMGHMGQFSFGHAAVFGVGAYTSAILSLRYGVPVWWGILAAIAVTLLAGFILGYVALRRTREFELAIITFALGAIVLSVAQAWHSLTGGMTGLHRVPAPPFDISAGGLELRSEFAFYWLALAVLIITIYAIHRFTNSRIGRAVRSIRENEDLASSIGVSPTYYYVIAFTVATGLGGLAGALYGHHLGFVNAGMLRLNIMVIMLMIVLVGGSGSLGGPVLGSAIYWLVSEQLRALGEEYRFLIFGGILLASIIFLPRGVFPSLASTASWLFEGTADRPSGWSRFVAQRSWLGLFVLKR